ncbi:hypothetical protein OAD15_06325 [Hyphomicrobiales bacterium]|nr:hypothetical protein [Hyphomicrobiales bacterium]
MAKVTIYESAGAINLTPYEFGYNNAYLIDYETTSFSSSLKGITIQYSADGALKRAGITYQVESTGKYQPIAYQELQYNYSARKYETLYEITKLDVYGYSLEGMVNDIIYAKANHGYLVSGNDTIYDNSYGGFFDTGIGNDTIYGYGGNDSIWIGTGNDTAYGGTGNDIFYTTSSSSSFGGTNYIYGQSGIDILYISDAQYLYRFVDVWGDFGFGRGQDFLYLLGNTGGNLSATGIEFIQSKNIGQRDINNWNYSDNNVVFRRGYSLDDKNYSSNNTKYIIDLGEYISTITYGNKTRYEFELSNTSYNDQFSISGDTISISNGSGATRSVDVTVTASDVSSNGQIRAGQTLAKKTFSVTFNDNDFSSNSTSGTSGNDTLALSSNDDDYIPPEGYSLSSTKNNNGPDISEFSSEFSSSGTQNYTSLSDIIVLTGQSFTLRGLEGDDVYIISSLIPKNFNGTLVDTSGNNIIEIPENILISKIEFTEKSARITIDNSKVITINGADKFNYKLSANTLDGNSGESFSYSELAELFGVNESLDIARVISGEYYTQSLSLNSSNFNIINVNNSTIITATSSSDEIRYNFKQSSGGVSLEGNKTISIKNFDTSNDKITLVNEGGSDLTLSSFKSLGGIDIIENSFDNNTTIYFSPDSSGGSGALTIEGVSDSDFNNISLSILSNSSISFSQITSGYELKETSDSSKKNLTEFNFSSGSGTLNTTSYDDFIVLTGGSTHRGLGGDDLYFVSNLISKNSSTTIVDTSGNNTIQIPENTFIDSIIFSNDSARMVFEDSRTITINGANEFVYNLGGNKASGDPGESLSYADFAAAFDVYDIVNLSGTENGTSDIYIV